MSYSGRDIGVKLGVGGGGEQLPMLPYLGLEGFTHAHVQDAVEQQCDIFNHAPTSSCLLPIIVEQLLFTWADLAHETNHKHLKWGVRDSGTFEKCARPRRDPYETSLIPLD